MIKAAGLISIVQFRKTEHFGQMDIVILQLRRMMENCTDLMVGMRI